MTELSTAINELAIYWRLAVVAALAIGLHLIITVFRLLANQLLSNQLTRRYRKLQSLLTLANSSIVFSIYFFAIGFILQEFGVSLSTYLASATVVGLAIGFGLQGVVQDVVTGLTFIFSDLVDVGDLVEISGQTGLVRAITMRFVELENAMGASVFIPNRTINNIINYPRGYVRCIVDITLPANEQTKDTAEQTAVRLMQTTHQQFPGILIAPPSLEGRIKLNSDKDILRIKFRIWPNRGQPIENTFVQEINYALKAIEPDYQSWMTTISYEVEARSKTRKNKLPWH